MDSISSFTSSPAIVALGALSIFIIFVLCCVTVSNTNKLKNSVKTLLKNDWLVSINVPFTLTSTSEVIKSFYLPGESILLNNGFIAFNTVSFPSGTTLSFKAASTLSLLSSAPDLQVSEHLGVFGGAGGDDTSGTLITIYNGTSVNIPNNLELGGVNVYISLQLSHAPTSGGPLQIVFLGNYANAAFEFGI